MKGYLFLGLCTLLPSFANAADSSCSFSCVITERRRVNTRAEVYVEGTRGRCRGQVLVTAIGPNAQTFAERYNVSTYLREGHSRRILRIAMPFPTDTCNVEFSQAD